MSLLGDLETATQTPESQCKAARILSALSPEERALAERLPAGRLGPVLGRNGSPVSASQIATHRRGGCSCHSKTT